MIFTDLPTDYIKQINTLLFQFLWSGHDKISRNTIFQDIFHGALGLPSVLHKRESIIIQTLRIQEILKTLQIIKIHRRTESAECPNFLAQSSYFQEYMSHQ